MARIIYALSGQGRGHTSRVMAISDELRRRGHEVVFCCGGTAQEILEAQGERVLPVPVLCHVMQDNVLQHGRTLRKNWETIRTLPEIVTRLATRLPVTIRLYSSPTSKGFRRVRPGVSGCRCCRLTISRW